MDSVLSNAMWRLTNPGGNYTNNGYPARIPTISAPPAQALTTGLQALGDGVIQFGHGGMEADPYLDLIPYGAGSATNTMGMKVLGWRAINLGAQLAPLWIPVELSTFAITLGTATGVVNTDLGTTALFATTITQTGGPTFITSGAPVTIEKWFQISPGSNAIGFIRIPSFGFRYMEVIFSTLGSATSCNALYCRG